MVEILQRDAVYKGGRATKSGSEKLPGMGWIGQDRLDAITQRTRDGGAEIVNLLKTSAWYAPASAVVEMVDAVLKDKKKILPCAAYLQGEFGLRDVYLGVPVKLGRRGVEQIIEIELLPEERAALAKSAEAVRELFRILKV